MMTTQRRLPTELLVKVLENLPTVASGSTAQQERQTLSTLAAVASTCKDALFIVRPMLYSHLNLHSRVVESIEEDDEDDMWSDESGGGGSAPSRPVLSNEQDAKLFRTLKSAPHLAALVTSVSWNFKGRAVQRTSRGLVRASHDAAMVEMKGILGRLPNVAAFAVNGGSWLWQAVNVLNESKLELDSLDFDTEYDHEFRDARDPILQTFLSSQPYLKSLRLAQPHMWRDLPQWSTPPPFHLRQLDLITGVDDVDSTNVGWSQVMNDLLTNSAHSLLSLRSPISLTSSLDRTYSQLTTLHLLIPANPSAVAIDYDLPILKFLDKCPQVESFELDGDRPGGSSFPATASQSIIEAFPLSLEEIQLSRVSLDVEAVMSYLVNEAKSPKLGAVEVDFKQWRLAEAAQCRAVCHERGMVLRSKNDGHLQT